ncbi:MAG: CDP-alcohol phosphatidyltransferase family protein [Acutalibacteraceae bacterium]
MKKDKLNILTIPNLLSFFRLVLIIPISVSYAHEKYLGCVIYLVISGLTDIADGFIARRFNMISAFGKIIDPIADKLTQAAAIILISTRHPDIWPLVVVFCIKEISMLFGALYLFNNGKRPSESKWWGKVSTLLLYLFCGLFIIADFIKFEIPVVARCVMIALPSAFVLFALVRYFCLFIDIAKGRYELEEERYKPIDRR